MTESIVTKKLTISHSAFSTEQILRTLQRTPSTHIYRRPAKGGGQWDYVTGTYIKKCLNYTFGWMWSSSILNIKETHGQVIATVRVTINRPDGTELLHKDDIGKKDVAMRKDNSGPLDYGNDEKAAVTDGIKRCAAQLGFASDVYGKEEFQEIHAEEYVDKVIPVGEHDNDSATQAQKDIIGKLGYDGDMTDVTQGKAKMIIAELLKGGKS